jgi:hypothetical protein
VSGALSVCLPMIPIQRQYYRFEPPEWNPARHLLYWGVGLACAGNVLSFITAIIACELIRF